MRRVRDVVLRQHPARARARHRAGFPFLPSGSQPVLGTVAEKIVLDNVRRQLRLTRREVVADIRSPATALLVAWLAVLRGLSVSRAQATRNPWLAIFHDPRGVA